MSCCDRQMPSPVRRGRSRFTAEVSSSLGHGCVSLVPCSTNCESWWGVSSLARSTQVVVAVVFFYFPTLSDCGDILISLSIPLIIPHSHCRLLLTPYQRPDTTFLLPAQIQL